MSQTTIPLILNGSNQVGTSNVYSLKFTQSVQIPKGSTLSIESASFCNCFKNITAKYGNNRFSFKWIDGVTYQYTIDDQGLDINGIGAYISSFLFNNNFYWYYDNKIQYPVVIQANSSYYACQTVIPPVPSATEVAGSTLYKKPTSATWSFPTNRITCQLTLVQPLATMLGYPSQNVFPVNQQVTTYSINSNVAPRMQTIYSIILKCNMIASHMLGADNMTKMVTWLMDQFL